MIKAATTVRAVTIALLVAACGLVGVLSTVNTTATHGSLPKPNATIEPGDAARKLVLSWGPIPSLPTGCTFSHYNVRFGKVGGPIQDSDTHRSDAPNTLTEHNSFQWEADDPPYFRRHNITAGEDYTGIVTISADCKSAHNHDSVSISGETRVTTKAPHSGPATGFSAVTGSAVNTIVLSWTNPSGPAVSSYEYRKKLSSDSTWPTSWTSTTGSATTLTISSLTGGSKYDIQFRVLTNSVPTKTLHASGVKAALVGRPATMTATSGSSSGEVNLAWGTVPAATAYQYQQKKHSANTWGSWTAAPPAAQAPPRPSPGSKPARSTTSKFARQRHPTKASNRQLAVPRHSSLQPPPRQPERP